MKKVFIILLLLNTSYSFSNDEGNDDETNVEFVSLQAYQIAQTVHKSGGRELPLYQIEGETQEWYKKLLIRALQDNDINFLQFLLDVPNIALDIKENVFFHIQVVATAYQNKTALNLVNIFLGSVREYLDKQMKYQKHNELNTLFGTPTPQRY